MDHLEKQGATIEAAERSPTLKHRIAYAAGSSALAAALLAAFGRGPISDWSSLAYWGSVVLVFVVALAIDGKVD
jgi:hypothetical protein